MAISSSVQLGEKSRYLKGGRTVILKDKIGWWNRYNFTPSADDFKLVIDSKYHQRPHLVAYDIYGRFDLMWFVLQYNNIIDVTTEFVVGAIITLPQPHRVQMNLL